MRSVAGSSQRPMNGPQRSQASAAVSHCARVVCLNWTGSNAARRSFMD